MLGIEQLQAGFGSATGVTMASRIKGAVLELHYISFFLVYVFISHFINCFDEIPQLILLP